MGLSPSQPNVELFSAECFGGPPELTEIPTPGKHIFCLLAELFGARSRGGVTLASADPLAAPVVDTGFLSDALDAEVLAEACRFANDIVMRGEGMAGVVKGSWPPEAGHSELQTRDEWVRHVRQNATTCYHASGTCAMGSPSDPLAVVDPNLCVRGVSGLRVADCSIIPLLGCCHTQMPAYGIGEKAADLIKATWSHGDATLAKL
ncbi:hypothetical protein CDD81_168 [Ophiocordyceps australis]|uniref:Glucose-methanol-choline oxidoreductase C-terminal domain-containing protein n=1 Tax=Ophiocordyceps australis TaxID=1399860 RepID=A0A2C5Y9D8_9HYPO|nr:hypothetical protein CDD81_168 [Ophiocordyceps australis]